MPIHFGEASSVFKQKCPHIKQFLYKTQANICLWVGRYVGDGFDWETDVTLVVEVGGIDESVPENVVSVRNECFVHYRKGDRFHCMTCDALVT